MKGLYFYRGETIMQYGNGWTASPGDFNIYKTVNDAKNAIDKQQGGFPTNRIPKRHGKPIKVVGNVCENPELLDL